MGLNLLHPTSHYERMSPQVGGEMVSNHISVQMKLMKLMVLPPHEIHKPKEEVPLSHKYETESLFEPQMKMIIVRIHS